MEYLILAVITVAQSAGSVLAKLYDIKTDKRSAYVYGGCSAFFAAMFFFVASGGVEFNPGFLGYSLGFGAAYATALVSTTLAFRFGSVALTTLVISLSLIIPTLYGIIFLNESVGAWLVVGLIMLILSLCLINMKKGSDRINVKWAIFAGFASLGNGMCSTVQKMEQVAFSGAYKNEFMIAALLMVSVICFAAALVTERREIAYCIKKGVIYTIFYGICNGTLNLLVMVLGNMMPASLMFPLISAFGIIGSFAVGRLFFKEKLSKVQLLGLLAGIVSIIFFNL